ncbi:ER membrane protein complex subunit 8/9-like protein [Iris pallida]|uniref:ER membrane protein complex subunit 8/9-like protein n=1 Tax=Iris pallida TaxID=29817 RepID=A0AAX6FYK8_IRIPA|nr:ER membrane protein complex subunit 8/9-like protein [Iris pallida]
MRRSSLNFPNSSLCPAIRAVPFTSSPVITRPNHHQCRHRSLDRRPIFPKPQHHPDRHLSPQTARSTTIPEIACPDPCVRVIIPFIQLVTQNLVPTARHIDNAHKQKPKRNQTSPSCHDEHPGERRRRPDPPTTPLQRDCGREPPRQLDPAVVAPSTPCLPPDLASRTVDQRRRIPTEPLPDRPSDPAP